MSCRTTSCLVASLLLLVVGAGRPASAQPCADYGAMPHAIVEGTFHANSALDVDDEHLCCATKTPLAELGGCEVGWFRLDAGAGLHREGTYVADVASLVGVKISGNLAVLAVGGTPALRIIDFGDPEAPVVLSELEAPASINQFQITDSLVVAAVSTDSLWIVDISDPRAPAQASLSDGRYGYLACEGNTCWATQHDDDDFSLVTLDISDPTKPVELNYLPIYGDSKRACNLDVHDGILALSYKIIYYDHFNQSYSSWLSVTDVSDPVSPVRIGGWGLGEGIGIGGCHGCAVGPDLIYVAEYGVISVIRVTPGGDLEYAYTVNQSTAGYSYCCNGGDLWLIGDHVIRISSGDYPSPFIGTHPFLHGYGDIIDLLSVDRYAFATYSFEGHDFEDGGNGTHVYDMSAIPEPTHIGTVAIYNYGAYDHITGYSHYIYTNSDYAGTWDWTTNTRVSDFHIERGFVVANQALYAVAPAGLEIFDLAEPADPPFIGSLLAGRAIQHLTVGPDRAYVLSTGYLDILNIQDPLAPTVTNTIEMTAPERRLAISGDRLYMAGADGLSIFDLSDPDQPLLAGHLTGFAVTDIEVSGNVAYLAAGSLGLLVIDVGDPAAPQTLGSLNVASLTDVTLVGTYLTTIDYRRRFAILALDCSDPLPVVVEDFTAAWDDAGFRIDWRLGRELPDLRLEGHLGERTWIVPWHREDAGYSALDLDGILHPGEVITYTLSSRNVGETWVELCRASATVPALTTVLLNPRPNPFNPSTTLAFTLDRPGEAVLTIHDLAGRELRRLVDGRLPSGRHALQWDGRDESGRELPAGTYLSRLRAGDATQSRKLSLVK